VYFYIDESGHTGHNLFDDNQPNLYYGMLISSEDLDIECSELMETARKKINQKRIHAKDLSLERLSEIIPELIEMHRKCNFRMNVYKVAKIDFAIIAFFDQVFDQGINPAVPWAAYWSPLRYILLVKLSFLFNREVCQDAWRARIEMKEHKAIPLFISVCQRLLRQVERLPDPRSIEIIKDALTWAIDHPTELNYQCTSKDEKSQISPNLIGFQFVAEGLAKSLSNGSEAKRIVIDQQREFNKPQQRLMDLYKELKDFPFCLGPDLPKMDLSSLPNTEIEFLSGDNSIGLEIVDVYLWLYKRFFEKGDLPPDLMQLVTQQGELTGYNEFSLSAIVSRWTPYFQDKMKQTISPEALASGAKLIEQDELRRKAHIKK
jgi:hypothetical protein